MVINLFSNYRPSSNQALCPLLLCTSSDTANPSGKAGQFPRTGRVSSEYILIHHLELQISKSNNNWYTEGSLND